MRFPKLFFRASKNAWYVQLGKRQVFLGKDRDEAFVRYRQLVLEDSDQSTEVTAEYTVAELCDLFLEHSIVKWSRSLESLLMTCHSEIHSTSCTSG